MSMLHAYLVVLSFLLAKANARDYTQSYPVDASRISSYNVSTLSNACDTNSDCGGIDWICVNKQCVANSETEGPLKDLSGVIGTFLSAAIASGCGLGGGGLLVPLYILTQHLSPQKAIPLSKAVIFGASISSLLVNLRRKHPLIPSRMLIDFDAVLLMEPMTLAGTVIGVTMITILPDYIVTILLVWLLYTTSTRMLKKGYNLSRQESQKELNILRTVIKYWQLLPLRKKTAHFQIMAFVYLNWKAPKLKTKIEPCTNIKIQSHHQFTSDDCQDQLLTDQCKKIQSSTHTYISSLVESKLALNRSEGGIINREESHTAHRNLLCDMAVLSLTWLSLILISLVKGGHGASSIVGIECGSYSYWAVIIFMPFFFCAITAYFAQRILRERAFLESYGYRYAEGEMRWDRRSVVRYPIFCSLAGVAAGMLGIGGGMVKGPILLEIGFHPQVASATSSTMIFFTSSATVIQYIILGSLDWTQAFHYGSIGFFAGIMGQYGVAFIVRKYRKTAFVIFMLAGVIGLSGLSLGALGIHNFIRNGFDGFKPLCHSQ